MPLRPDLNGARVKHPLEAAIYLIDRGQRRWIPDPPTYNNLFRDWNGIIVDIGIIDIDLGPQITPGALLARGVGTPAVFLVDNGTKRWITSPAAMDRYYFNWNTIQQVPNLVLQYVPTADQINA